MKKRRYYFKVYGIPTNPKPLREVFLETFETKAEADAFIHYINKLQGEGAPVYKAYKIKTGAYRKI